VVSLTDFTFLLKKKTTVEEVNTAIEKASKEAGYRPALAVTREPLVSSDFIGNPYSSIVDLSLTKVVDGDLVKVMAWYDNEWGTRIVGGIGGEDLGVGSKLNPPAAGPNVKSSSKEEAQILTLGFVV